MNEENTKDTPGKVIRVDFRRRAVISEHEGAAAVSPLEPARLAPDVVAPLRGESDDVAAQVHASFDELIAQGLVLVTLDSRHAGVDVPAKFRGLAQLNLSFSHRFRIEDFEYDAEGIRASLSFGGDDHYCVIPWAAVYILRCEAADRVDVFPQHAPEEIRPLIDQLQREP